MTLRTHIFAVAVEEYHDPKIPKVIYSENDATKFVEAWQELGVDPADCVILLSASATMAAIESRLRRFLKNVGPDDRVIFFYAGHGATFSDVSYITAHDTQRGDIMKTSLSLSSILDSLRSCKSTQILIFLDSCHSGLPINAGMRSIYSGFTGDELADFCKDAKFHLAFAACDSDESSFPSRNLKHGIWTHCVIQAILGLEKRALDKGRFVTSMSLQGFLSVEVPRILRLTITGTETQTPCVWGKLSKEIIVADLAEVFRARKSLSSTPENIIKESSLIGDIKGQVRQLSGYSKPLYPLSKYSSWEESFVARSGEPEVKDKATKIYDELKSGFGYKRRDIDVSIDGSVATIKTPDFDVNISLWQDPEDAEGYIFRVEVATFRRPEVIGDPKFIKIFSNYCDSVVIVLEAELDIQSKIDEIEEIESLSDCINYDAHCSWFTLVLEESGIDLYATSEQLVFTLRARGDLNQLIGNTHKAVAQLAGASVILGLPGEV